MHVFGCMCEVKVCVNLGVYVRSKCACVWVYM